MAWQLVHNDVRNGIVSLREYISNYVYNFFEPKDEAFEPECETKHILNSNEEFIKHQDVLIKKLQGQILSLKKEYAKLEKSKTQIEINYEILKRAHEKLVKKADPILKKRRRTKRLWLMLIVVIAICALFIIKPYFLFGI